MFPGYMCAYFRAPPLLVRSPLFLHELNNPIRFSCKKIKSRWRGLTTKKGSSVPPTINQVTSETKSVGSLSDGTSPAGQDTDMTRHEMDGHTLKMSDVDMEPSTFMLRNVISLSVSIDIFIYILEELIRYAIISIIHLSLIRMVRSIWVLLTKLCLVISEFRLNFVG
jgi:hypothetical protein